MAAEAVKPNGSIDSVGGFTLRVLRKRIESGCRLWCGIIARTDPTHTDRTTVLRRKFGTSGFGSKVHAERRFIAKPGDTFLGGVGVHQGIKRRTTAIGVLLLAAAVSASSGRAETLASATSGTILQPVVWQGPEISAPASNPVPEATQLAGGPASPLVMAQQSATVPPLTPPQRGQVPAVVIEPNTTPRPVAAPTNPNAVLPNATIPSQPLLDDNSPTEDLMPPVVEGCPDACEQAHVKPYGGGHPTDWSWGCGGSPYRTGPGMCDNWKVGPRWHVTIDGLVMSREETNLVALADQMFTDSSVGITGTPQTENFSYGPGGRITVTSEVPRYVGYQLQAAYEGINNWNSSIVYPVTTIPAGDPLTTQQRALHYTTDYNSGEISWVRSWSDNWHPFCGVRYMKIGDRLQDVLDQESPGPPTVLSPTSITDTQHIVDIDNNLMGFQIGMLKEAWRVNQRFTLEGFVNAGVYYNQVKYFNGQGSSTTQLANNFTSISANNQEADLSEISYATEASLSGVCRLNKCWALRAGYQILWINNLHLADSAFLGNPNSTDSMLFQGWHAGFECRR